MRDRLVGEQPKQLPARDWGQVRQDWQQRRDQLRDNWQDWRDQARDDWQNWFDDHYWRYGRWYWGHAPLYWARWDYLWDRYAVAAAVGLTWWGASTLGYQFGCEDYYNPYYTETMTVDNSEPVITVPLEVADQSPSGLPPGVSEESIAKFDRARAAFLEGKYDAALKLTDEAVAQMPRDAVLHEFRSLVLFALKRYAESAAAIHAVLAVGPGWDWKTMSSLYPDKATYTAQLRALETARDNNPKSPEIRFLLGYHYLTLGHSDAALHEFRRGSELRPNDAVMASLLATLAPRDPPAAKTAGAAPKAIPADAIAGEWTAAGRGSAKYSMDLRKDGTFIWAFVRGSRKQEVKGVHTLEGNVLAMEPDSGGVLLAELSSAGPDSLRFQMIGGPADDPTLEFRRARSE